MISYILRSKEKYETRFKRLEDYLDNKDYVDQTINDDILYLKLKKNKGNFKTALQSNHREINYNTIDRVISKMQNLRNKNLKNKSSLNYSYLEDVIDGKEKFYLKDRLSLIDSKLKNNIGSLEDLDSAKYVLARIKDNKYMQKKSEINDIREKVSKRLEDYIKKNENHYFKKRKSPFLKYAAIGAIALSSIFFLKDKQPRKDMIPVKKEIRYKAPKKEKVFVPTITPVSYTNYKAIIHKSNQEMTILGKSNNDWQEIKSYQVSTGLNLGNKKRVGDKKTPEGTFNIISKEKSNHWIYDGHHAYGPWFLRLGTPWQGIGIHGTDEPQKIGTRASRGCIRMRNKDLLEFINKYSSKDITITIVS